VSRTEALSRETPEACRRCGEPSGRFRYCLNCGAPLHADELGPVAGTQPQPSRIRRALRGLARWRTPLVVFPLLAGLAIVGGLGAQMLTEKIPPAASGAQVTCWDGGTVESADACTAPSGVDGLRWVFPTFHPDRDRCVDVLVAHPEYLRPAMYECDLKVSKHWVSVTYMQLADVDAGRRYFEKSYPRSEREKVRTAGGTPYRYVWRKATDEGYELAAMYMDFPYAVSIRADATAYGDQALRELAFRHPDRIRVADPSS
jgi:hypothetical protein